MLSYLTLVKRDHGQVVPNDCVIGKSDCKHPTVGSPPLRLYWNNGNVKGVLSLRFVINLCNLLLERLAQLSRKAAVIQPDFSVEIACHHPVLLLWNKEELHTCRSKGNSGISTIIAHYICDISCTIRLLSIPPSI